MRGQVIKVGLRWTMFGSRLAPISILSNQHPNFGKVKLLTKVGSVDALLWTTIYLLDYPRFWTLGLLLLLSLNMAADGFVVPESVHESRSKKSKLKYKHVAANAEDTVMASEESGGTSKREKRKRNKSDDAKAEDTNQDQAEHKRRRKEAAATDGMKTESEFTEATAAVESKEERKKRRKEKRAQREALAQTDAQNGISAAAAAMLPTPPATAPASGMPTPPPSEIITYLSKNNITIHSLVATIVPILKFSQLASYGVDERLIKATDKFKEPSFIQACSWPALLMGNDVVGIAETGR